MMDFTRKAGVSIALAALILPFRAIPDVNNDGSNQIVVQQQRRIALPQGERIRRLSEPEMRHISESEIPDLEAPIVFPAQQLTDSGFTARWTPVKDAEGYALEVRRAEKLTADETKVVFSENFSKVTQGTTTRPVHLGFESRLPGLTQQPGWEGMDCYQAAGMIGLGPKNGTLAAMSVLYLPPWDVSNNDGHFDVHVKFVGTPGDQITVGYSLDPEDFIHPEDGEEVYTLQSATDEHTFSFTQGARSSSIYLLSEADHFIFIDEITISQSVKAGSAWSSTVFYEELDGGDLDTYEVAGLYLKEKGYRFFYDVLAFSYVAPTVLNRSGLSNQMEIVFPTQEVPDLTAPVAYPAENITDTSFTARWTPVPYADGYALDVRRAEQIWQDGDITVFSEDFSGIKLGTVSSPVNLGIQNYLTGMTEQPGWEAMDCLAAQGMIGLGGNMTTFGYSVLFFPPMDVSNQEGEFTIHLKLLGTAGDVIRAEYTLDPSDVIPSPDGPKEYVLQSSNDECSFTFTAGTRFSSIKLSSKEGNRKPVFIDEISIGHAMKRGDMFSTTCFYEEFDDPDLYMFDVNGVEINKGGSSLYYDVLAYDIVYPSERVLNRSDWSNSVIISDMTPIEEIHAENVSPVKVDRGRVYITAGDQETVYIYAVTGALVYQEKAAGEVLSVELPTGLYIVRTGKQTVKILVR